MFYKCAKIFLKIFAPLVWNIRVDNVEGLSKDGAYIISCNHNYWLDPVIIAMNSKRTIHFLSKVELFKNKFIGWFLKKLNAIPIEREKADIGAVKNVLRVLKDDGVVGIFPEGTRTVGPETKPMHDGATFFALRAGCPIIPCGIAGDVKFRGKQRLCVGEPIIFEEFKDKKPSSEDMKAATAIVEKEIAKLAKKAEQML